MNNTEWRYYNHAIVSSGEPHEIVDISSIENGTIWNIIKDS